MTMKLLLRNALVGLTVASLALAPLSSFAQGRGHGKSKGKWNAASPKKNGRHDNRDWNKRKSDWSRRDSFNRSRTQPSYQYQPNYRYQSEYDRRNQTKNEWRNLAIASGAVGLLGLLTKDSTLTFAGGAGALYS
ncbi:hypothetical protein B7486_74330, partial [cyanobacterium TDX16]